MLHFSLTFLHVLIRINFKPMENLFCQDLIEEFEKTQKKIVENIKVITKDSLMPINVIKGTNTHCAKYVE